MCACRAFKSGFKLRQNMYGIRCDVLGDEPIVSIPSSILFILCFLIPFVSISSTTTECSSFFFKTSEFHFVFISLQMFSVLPPRPYFKCFSDTLICHKFVSLARKKLETILRGGEAKKMKRKKDSSSVSNGSMFSQFIHFVCSNINRYFAPFLCPSSVFFFVELE